MKEKCKNLERVIFFILLCFFIAAIPFLLKKRAAHDDILNKKIQKLSVQSSKGIARLQGYNDDEEYTKQEGKTPRSLSLVTSKRNIFTPQVYNKRMEIVAVDRPVLQVSEIGFKPLGIEYQGKVFFQEDNTMVAQVNVLEKSYLVKEGTSFAAYKVDELNEEFIKLKDKKGKVIKIEYRQKVYTNELVAKIKELTSAYCETVSENDTFLEYKVLDIDEDSVLLSNQGQHLRLEKGMIHK